MSFKDTPKIWHKNGIYGNISNIPIQVALGLLISRLEGISI